MDTGSEPLPIDEPDSVEQQTDAPLHCDHFISQRLRLLFLASGDCPRNSRPPLQAHSAQIG